MPGSARNPSASTGRRLHRVRDLTFYPVEGKVGEDSIPDLDHGNPAAVDRAMVHGPRQTTFVGADQFIYYKRYHPAKVVAPDVYDLPGVPPGGRVRSWKVWKTGIVPNFAIEVVSSSDPYKDY